MPFKYHSQFKGYEWLKKKKCRISSILLLLSETDIFQIDTSVIETFVLHVNRIPNQHEINQLNVKHNLKKITHLQISNMEENNGTMINKLISHLINLKKNYNYSNNIIKSNMDKQFKYYSYKTRSY